MVEPGSHLEIIHNLRAELRGIEHEHDVAREACENLTAMRDAAVRERDEAVALLREAEAVIAKAKNKTASDTTRGYYAATWHHIRAFLSRLDRKAGAR